MRFREIDRCITGNSQPAIRKCACKSLGIGDDALLIDIAEMIHFVGRHQQPQKRAKVVIAEAAREGPPLNSFPEFVPGVFFSEIHRRHTSLGAKIGFMGRTGDHVGALIKRLLKIRSHQPEDMGHVIHQHAVQGEFVDGLTDFSDGLAMDDHALSKDNQLRLVLGNQFAGRIDVNFKVVVRQDREIDHRRPLPLRVAHHIIPECAHGLGAQMSTLDDVIVHYLPYPALLAFTIGTIDMIHHCAEDGHIGHLPGDQSCLDFRAAQIALEFTRQQVLDLINKIRALVVEDIGLHESFNRLVLRIAPGRIED